MAYISQRLGGGLNLKSASDVAPDGSLVTAQGCSFDTVGALGSARGRTKLNGGAVIDGASILGHFDGTVSGAKTRFTKCGTTLYKDFGTPLADPIALYPGRTLVAYGSGNMTGFAYGDFVYVADGTTIARYNGSTPEAWGLVSPGYQEITNTDPIATATSTTQTITTPFPIDTGMSSTQNIELVGMVPLQGLKGSEINRLHYANAVSTNGDVSVTCGASSTANITPFVITFTRLQANQYQLEIQRDISLLTGGSPPNTWTHTTIGGRTHPTISDVQTIDLTSATGGSFKLGFRAPLDYNKFSSVVEWTQDIPYNADAAAIQLALIGLPSITGDATIYTPATVTGASTFTITTATAATGTGSGGGSIGFMRQGPLATVNGSAGDLEVGLYNYAYTFYNGVAESNFSARVPVDVTAQNSWVQLSQILPGPVGTTERRVYRSDVNQKQLYYIGKIEDNTTTTFSDYNKLPPGALDDGLNEDDITDFEVDEAILGAREVARRRGLLEAEINSLRGLNTNLGLLSDWTDHDPPPLGLSEVGLLADTVFGIADGELRFSESGNPEHWPLSNRLKTGRNASETALTWRAFDRDCIIYSDSALYRFSQIGLTFADSRYEEIESPVGLAGARAIASLDGQQGHIFLAKTGLYLFDGARVNEISYSIEKMFTDSTHADYIHPESMSGAWMVTSRDRMYMAYSTTNTTPGTPDANDRMLFCDFQDMQDPKFSVIEWDFSCLSRERIDNTLIAGDTAGYVYQMDSGWTDDGGTIEWDWTTKQYRLNGGQAFRLDEVFLDANLAGASTTVAVTMQQRSATKSAVFTISPTGRQRIQLKVPTYMKGEGVTVNVASTGAVERTAYGLEFTYLPMGEP